MVQYLLVQTCKFTLAKIVPKTLQNSQRYSNKTETSDKLKLGKSRRTWDFEETILYNYT